MNIGIQGWFWNQEFTGIGVHLRNFVDALLAHPEHKVHLVVPEKPSETPPGLIIHELKPWPLWPAGLKKWAWERFQVPHFWAKLDLDLEHYPYPCPLPRTARHARSMTVHDRILWEDARYQAGPLKRYYHRLAQQSLQKVDTVFAVSKTVQAQIHETSAHFLPNAVSAEFSTRTTPTFAQRPLVYMGGYDLRKRVPELIAAFEKIHEEDPRYELWLLGTPHHQSRYYPELPDAPGVHKIGSLSTAEYIATLKRAFAFVHASDSEGFNLPLLEAMAVGVPAIVADIPVNHEVSQETALFWNPSHPPSLQMALHKFEDPVFYQSQTERALSASKVYTWANSAKIFLDVITLSRPTTGRKN